MSRFLRDPGWLATVAIGAAALVVAATLIAIRLTSPSERAVIQTEAWPWRSDGVAVTPVAADSAFLAGDIVVAMDGRPIAAWAREALRPPWDVRPAAIGSSVTFDVERAGRVIRLEVVLGGFPIERIGGAPIGLVTFGAGVLVLAFLLVVRRARSTALRVLFVGAASNIADIVAWELGLQPTDLAGGTPFVVAFASAAIFNLVFWSAIVHILTIYPVRSPLAARRPLLIPLIYGAPLAAFAVLAIVAALAGGTILDWIDRLASVVGAVASGMLVLVLGSTVAGYRRTPATRRRGVRAIAATLLFAATATLVLLTGPIALTGSPFVPRSVVSFLVLPVPIALAAAVIRDRLFQVSLLSRSRERIVAAREEERRLLRRELHDGLAPTLAAIALKLDLARGSVRTDPDGTEAAIDAARGAVRATIADIRRVARDLRPPALDALGLVGALRQQAESLGGQPGRGPVIIVDAPEPMPALPAAVEVAAYRIAVEAVMNAVRHAGASTCRIHVRLADDELQVDVEDDGRGIAKGAGGVGTRSMHERAAEVGGAVTVEAMSRGGTLVAVRLPVDLAARRG